MSKINSFLYIFTTILISFSYDKLKPLHYVNFEKGEAIFRSNCIICHLGGNNIIIPEKNLKKEALETNGMNTLQAVTYQIINGKNGMPAFSGRLKEEDMEEVANYILFQSLNNFEN